MARTIDPNQTEKIDRSYVQPIYLVKLLLDGLTLYFSDRNIPYNSQNWEDYLYDLSGIGNEIRNLGGYNNTQITLRFKNERIQDKNYLIELFDDYPPEKKYVEIYKLYIDTGETFASDVSTKIFKGEMGQPFNISELGFKINCSSMLFGKNASLPLDVIDLADYPLADPDDVGAYRNIIYGDVKKVICPWTVAGWASTLTEAISASATSVVVSEATGSPATPFTMICDNEQIRVTNKSGTTFTVTRGYGGTTAVIHNKSAICYEQRSDFQAEVAQHPVKSINDIYVWRGYDSGWVRVVSGVTKYTNSDGRAFLTFSDKIKWEEKPNLIPETNTGLHPHTGSGSASTTAKTTKICIPTSAAGGSNPGYAIDGNEGSYCGIPPTQALAAYFTESSLGTVSKQYIWIYNYSSAATGAVYCGGTGIGTVAPTVGWHRLVKNGGAWNDSILIQSGSSGNSIAEVYKEVEYTPTISVSVSINNNPADGVSTLLSGNSVANMMIGQYVAADVEGYQDDGAGTYTGTPDALIERPDHVRKHILIALLGFSGSDIDSTSFASVGTTYAGRISGGYKLSFILHEVATKTMDLFEEIDKQTRSNMFESGGVFKLIFNSTSVPPSQMTFNKDNIKSTPVFSKTEVADIRNKIRGHYFRDYSKFGDLADKYQKVNEKPDAVSIAKYGLMQEDMEFSCIGDLSNMVNDVLDWVLLQKKELKRIVEINAFWDAMALEHCDHFKVTSKFWSNRIYKLLACVENRDTTLTIRGMEGVIPEKRYLVTEARESLVAESDDRVLME